MDLGTRTPLFQDPEGNAYATVPVGDHDETWRLRAELAVGFLLGCFGKGPYPDPAQTPDRPAPRDERDLIIAANNGHVVAFDDLSCFR